MAIPQQLLDDLLKQVDNPEDLFGKDGLISACRRQARSSPLAWSSAPLKVR